MLLIKGVQRRIQRINSAWQIFLNSVFFCGLAVVP